MEAHVLGTLVVALQALGYLTYLLKVMKRNSTPNPFSSWKALNGGLLL